MYKNIDSAIKHLDKEIERVYRLYDKANKNYLNNYNPGDWQLVVKVGEISDQLHKLKIAKKQLEEANRLCVHTL